MRSAWFSQFCCYLILVAKIWSNNQTYCSCFRKFLPSLSDWEFLLFFAKVVYELNYFGFSETCCLKDYSCCLWFEFPVTNKWITGILFSWFMWLNSQLQFRQLLEKNDWWSSLNALAEERPGWLLAHEIAQVADCVLLSLSWLSSTLAHLCEKLVLLCKISASENFSCIGSQFLRFNQREK